MPSVFRFCWVLLATALSNHPGLLMSVVTKTSEIENRNQRKEIESVSWPWNTQFPQDDLSSAEIVFHREAARAQRDHVFCSHKKDSADHSVLIFQPSRKDSLRNVQAKSGQVDFPQCYVLFTWLTDHSRYFNVHGGTRESPTPEKVYGKLRSQVPQGSRLRQEKEPTE